jgi:hypothetical protein
MINGAYTFFSRLATIVQRKYVYPERMKNFTHIITYINIKKRFDTYKSCYNYYKNR